MWSINYSRQSENPGAPKLRKQSRTGQNDQATLLSCILVGASQFHGRRMNDKIRNILNGGIAIPACPLALTDDRVYDEASQRGLVRYYSQAGAGGLAVGVHTTQFAIREPRHNLFATVLRTAADEMDAVDQTRTKPMVRVGGICGRTDQAVSEARLLRELGYQAGLLGLGAMRDATEDELIAHCRAVADEIPVFGFYLHAAVGGRELPYSFWCRFAEIENVVAIKIAAFNRYQTIDVIRALAEAGRDDVALYTGNDDNIVMDLLTPYRFRVGDRLVERRFVGGLLGHWAVWTGSAVKLLARCHEIIANGDHVPPEMLRLANEVTDCNAVLFDAANGFRGCIPGVNEVLRRQGLLRGPMCLDPAEVLSPGQSAEIDRIHAAYPHLTEA